jgi:hypothetical protein
VSIDPASLSPTGSIPPWLSGTAPLLRFQSGGTLERNLTLGQVVEGRMRAARGDLPECAVFIQSRQMTKTAMQAPSGDVQLPGAPLITG